jgi:hypothetical protein
MTTSNSLQLQKEQAKKLIRVVCTSTPFATSTMSFNEFTSDDDDDLFGFVSDDDGMRFAKHTDSGNFTDIGVASGRQRNNFAELFRQQKKQQHYGTNSSEFMASPTTLQYDDDTSDSDEASELDELEMFRRFDCTPSPEAPTDVSVDGTSTSTSTSPATLRRPDGSTFAVVTPMTPTSTSSSPVVPSSSTSPGAAIDAAPSSSIAEQQMPPKLSPRSAKRVRREVKKQRVSVASQESTMRSADPTRGLT